MKRLVRRAVAVVLMVILTTGLAMAMTSSDASAASKKKIPNTNAKADARVVDAFIELGFTVKYDSSMDYAGLFSVGKHSIILKRKNATTTLHEMGHFLSRLLGEADSTSEFKAIYKAEKSKYNGIQKTYITKSSKEYFAQSFAEYTQKPKTLKKERPQTYQYINKMVNSVEESHVTSMFSAYGWAW